MAFLQTTTLAANEFNANGSTWRVTLDGNFIVLLRDGSNGEYIGHCGPAKQWAKEVQQAALLHLVQLEIALSAQLKQPTVKADPELYRQVKRDLWTVRDALITPDDIAAATY